MKLIRFGEPGKEKLGVIINSKWYDVSGLMGKPDEVAALVLYLASDEVSFITGCDYRIDGGY